MSDKRHKFYELQLQTLRGELQHLKTCQITFLSVSATATGTIFTIANVTQVHDYTFTFLIPLLFVLPSWSIFFDKARTVSRAVGYCRIIEQLINGAAARKFEGWETDLGRFRKEQEDHFKNLKELRTEPPMKDRIIPQINNSYWLWSYGIFFSLAWLSILISSAMICSNAFHKPPFLLCFLLVSSIMLTAWISWRNMEIYRRFTIPWKINSYDTNEAIWKEVVGFEAKKNPQSDPVTETSQGTVIV